jgi:hypothetical protein
LSLDSVQRLLESVEDLLLDKSCLAMPHPSLSNRVPITGTRPERDGWSPGWRKSRDRKGGGDG